GVAWLELSAAEASAETVDDDEPSGAVDAIFEPPPSEVLYSAPDAPPAETEDLEIPEADEGDIDEPDVEVEAIPLESHWRAGARPLEPTVPFPIERYPEIIDDYDADSFGVALKLAGTPAPGEESVVNAFFALWLSVYQDERAEEFEPFQRADVIHDRRHRS